MKGLIVDANNAILEIAEISIPGSRMYQVAVKLKTPVSEEMIDVFFAVRLRACRQLSFGTPDPGIWFRLS